ncbi:MAG: CBS domain-containing protein [Chloroflexaceae bacterium]|nr:CBS domain-containing protein [Chloroflexaceae bacterium]NJL32775.1 CBS domain-containing protein [Chloroflexaceae bacterium]NJO04626.1 CBS domain-containing protein [Chloroflexaceae bacterium]
MKAREIMTSNVVSVREDNSVEDAARLLARHRISGMPVVNRTGVLVGLITEHDLIAKSGTIVADIMTQNVITVGADTDVESVAHLLANQRIRRVPVLEDGKLVGILSRADLVRQIAMRWVCAVCGEMVRSASVPHECPRCGAKESFSHEVEPPGM